jgi:hypothetical protein
MNENEQNITIAKFLGWTNCRLAVMGAGAPERQPILWGVPPFKKKSVPIPNFMSVLKAIYTSKLP